MTTMPATSTATTMVATTVTTATTAMTMTTATAAMMLAVGGGGDDGKTITAVSTTR